MLIEYCVPFIMIEVVQRYKRLKLVNNILEEIERPEEGMSWFEFHYTMENYKMKKCHHNKFSSATFCGGITSIVE